ncbi:MAG: DUF3352 domain-containing protein [Oscillatoriales cyanobacterium SM2_2_1]|nr:DUF3352 domain-containing protein [Oscillatoriales cyanobacterium SM2_2_1]
MKKSFLVGLVLCAIGLLTVGIGLGAQVLTARTADLWSGAQVEPLAVEFLPRRSPLMVSFLTNPERLERFGKLALSPGKRRQFTQEWQQWQRILKETWMLDYATDIRPWLGDEVTLAVTAFDLDRNPDNGKQPGYLLALAAEDLPLAKQMIAQFWQRVVKQGEDLGFEQYQGIPLTFTNAIAGAQVGSFMIFANSPQVLRTAINDLQVPKLSLQNADLYRQSLESMGQGYDALAYVNIAEMGDGLPEAGLLLSVVPTPTGLKAEAALASTDLSLSTKSQIRVGRGVLSAFPVGSSVIAGHDLAGAIAQVQTLIRPYPQLQNFAHELVSHLTHNWSFPLDSESLGWATGDYALAFLPNQSARPEWILFSEYQDSESAAGAITQLDSTARSAAKLTVGDIELEQTKVTVWTKLTAIATQNDAAVAGTVVAVHAQTPTAVLISNSLGAIEETLTPPSSNLPEPLSDLPSDSLQIAYWQQPVRADWLGISLPDIGEASPLYPLWRRWQTSTWVRLPSETPTLHRGQILLTFHS